MTGLTDTDIKLDTDWNLTPATDGDAPLVSDLECLYQAIVLEALTQEGDLFYDDDYGWSLYDFINSEDDELTEIEIANRAREKLGAWEVIDPDSIETDVSYADDAFTLVVSFQFQDADEASYSFTIAITPIDVEVVESD